eukprot:TRINITY_DN3685_c0_g1_i3.p1 TRINITY_DN3685_c0_g1~~TRINITY_DN3685_c0_g1_i3.p1  ORF type:complete len:163 (-),score=45.61 TRINITY_DN3685_c0_g1_i3:262-750(-)
MLRPAATRLTAAQVLQHSWLETVHSKRVKEVMPVVVTRRLRKFRRYQKIKQAVLTYLATQLSEKEIASLRTCFVKLDKNGDGVLSMEEIIEGLKKAALSENFLEIAQSLDTNDSGYIDYNEFLAASMLEDMYLKEEKLYQAFYAFDLVEVAVTIKNRIRVAT